MKISHESPLCLLEESRKYNDYDYCLVHLFETEPTYLQFFKDSLTQGRTVLLDNSIFELGTAFDSDRYAQWIKDLQPTEYIIPDVLEDALGTMDNALDWKEKYLDEMTAIGSKSIGVVQGKTYADLVQCYDYLDKIVGVDKIAISFDYSYYLEVCPHPNKWMGYALGRVQTLNQLRHDGVINEDKPHHLLGCALPIEFMFYREGFNFLESLDTSNPIVHALLGKGYEPGGLVSKKSLKLIELLHTPSPSPATMHTIKHNISYFRSYVRGFA